MSEPITDLETAVRVLGALPMPAGPDPELLAATLERRTQLLLAVQGTARRLRKEANGRKAYGDCLKAENAELRAEVAALRAERHTTNAALADTTVALRAAESHDLGTLPAWLCQRFDPRSPDWDNLSDDDRAYWEHQARAVQRAVQRGGFKASQQNAGDEVDVAGGA
ncbi:hypothetical protein [Streptomyces sp. 1222.5]|uniref:hypothetical protein n=1 Tax=Streptomyces sp. 1222.5 TaxID=1881026 RepID=UPI003EBF927E